MRLRVWINGQSVGEWARARLFSVAFACAYRCLPDDIVLIVMPRFTGSRIIQRERITEREREYLAQQVQFGTRPEEEMNDGATAE